MWSYTFRGHIDTKLIFNLEGHILYTQMDTKFTKYGYVKYRLKYYSIYLTFYIGLGPYERQIDKKRFETFLI